MAIQEISAFSNFSGTNEQGYVIVGGSNGVEGGKKILSDIVPVVPEQVQADWEQDDNTQKDYIKNKPDVSNKIESISIADTKLVPDENKNVNINLTNGGLTLEQCILKINTGTGGLYVNDGELDIHCEYPLTNNPSSDGKCIKLSYDDSTLLTGAYGLEVANPVPDTYNANDGDVLTYNEDTDEIVWATPQNSEIQLPSMPTKNGTGGELNETTTRIRLVGECNYDDHFTLKWEYE